MTIINEIFIRSIDIRVAVRTVMIGNSYVETAKIFVETIKYIRIRRNY